MEAVNISIELLSVLFLIAMLAGFLDTLAGGGGLITIPALILSGIPALSVLGTNKLQGSMGTATATFLMLKNKRITWSEVKPFTLFAFMGAALGTLLVQFIDPKTLSFIIPIVLFFIAIYFLVSPLPKENKSKSTTLNKYYKSTIIPIIGVYDGMFGPGTGSFFTLAGISCKGYGLVYATALAKPLNFSTNIASLFVFITTGHVVWIVGLSMMFGQIIGAWLGSHYLFKINPSYLRFVVVIMCTGMLLKYSYSLGWIKFT